MGCDIDFYLLNVEKYMKELRPKLIKYYGIVNYDKVIREERRRIEFASFMKQILKSPLSFLKFQSNLTKQGPLSKNMVKQQFQQGDLYDQISDYIKNNAVEVESMRNHFLRMEDYLQEIDSFQALGDKIKVCNIIQVQNYINYIKLIKNTLEKDPKCQFNNQYYGVEEAQEAFEEVFKQMKESKEDCYFILRWSN